MGGQSESTWKVEGSIGKWDGVARIVPSLKAPGFTIAMTNDPTFTSFPDVSEEDGLLLGLRNAGGNVTSWKVAFCDTHINPYRCQFGAFKASFELPASDDFQEVFVPWNKFSDKWSAATGAHTSENPPQPSSLKSVTQLQLWVEGVAGDFHLQVKSIQASKKPASSDAESVEASK